MFLNILFFINTVFGLDPQSYPIFLKYGYSSVVEFEETPTRAVLGDSHSFQVEKVDKSLVIRPLINTASSNLFIYFKSHAPRLIILTASDESKPTLFKKFESFIRPIVIDKKIVVNEIKPRASTITKYTFDKKKDFLNIEFVLVADSKNKIEPKWDQIQLKVNKVKIKADKIWSERKEIQKDTYVKARAAFIRPNVSDKSESVSLIIPTSKSELIFPLKKESLK